MFWTIGLIPGRRQVKIFTPAGLPPVAIPRKSQAFCRGWYWLAGSCGMRALDRLRRRQWRKDDEEQHPGCREKWRVRGFHRESFPPAVRPQLMGGRWVGASGVRCCATSASGQGAALPRRRGQGCARLRSGQSPASSLLAFWVQIILLAI